MLKIKAYALGPIETNCYIAYDSETLEGIMIDPAEYDQRVSRFIEGEGITVKYIVNTHGHYDHIGGDKEFGYPVLIHEDDKACLWSPIRSLSIAGGMMVKTVKPAGVLKDNALIQLRGISFKVIHTPGHTPGGIALECEDALFTGDTLFCESVGRTDIPFSSQRDLERSVRKLMMYDDNTRIFPGHGRESTIGHERKYNPFLSDLSETL